MTDYVQTTYTMPCVCPFVSVCVYGKPEKDYKQEWMLPTDTNEGVAVRLGARGKLIIDIPLDK